MNVTYYGHQKKMSYKTLSAPTCCWSPSIAQYGKYHFSQKAKMRRKNINTKKPQKTFSTRICVTKQWLLENTPSKQTHQFSCNIDGSYRAGREGVLASSQHHWRGCDGGIWSRHCLQGVWERFPCDEQPFPSVSWGRGSLHLFVKRTFAFVWTARFSN